MIVNIDTFRGVAGFDTGSIIGTMKHWQIFAKRRMAELGITQESLRPAFGNVTRGAVGHYLSDRRQASIEQLQALAKRLDCTLDEMLGEDERQRIVPSVNDVNDSRYSCEKLPDEIRKIPILSSVPVIGWHQIRMSEKSKIAQKHVAVACECSPGAFALPVTGQAMHDRYRDGEYVVVDPGISPTKDCDVVVELSDGRFLLRNYRDTPEGVQLVAANPGWPDRIMLMPPDARVVGVVTVSFQFRL